MYTTATILTPISSSLARLISPVLGIYHITTTLSILPSTRMRPSSPDHQYHTFAQLHPYPLSSIYAAHPLTFPNPTQLTQSSRSIDCSNAGTRRTDIIAHARTRDAGTKCPSYAQSAIGTRAFRMLQPKVKNEPKCAGLSGREREDGDLNGNRESCVV